MRKLRIIIMTVLMLFTVNGSVFVTSAEAPVQPVVDKVEAKDNIGSKQKTKAKKETKKKSKKSKTYTEEDLYVMSHVIMGEAEGESWEEKIGVGSVVLNRVKDERFPNTIKDVVFQEGQYACTWDGNYDKTPNKESVKAAKYLLKNGSQMPSEVIFQSTFIQGQGVYKQIGNTYFCY